MKLKYGVIPCAAALLTASLLAQGGGIMSVQDLKQPGFRLSTSSPGFLVIAPFDDLFKGKDIRKYLKDPVLEMTIAQIGQNRSTVPGNLRSDQWEFTLPKLRPDYPYVAEFVLRSQLDETMAITIGKKIVRVPAFREELGGWAIEAFYRLGPNEPSFPPPLSDRIGPKDPVPAQSAKELHDMLVSALQKQLPDGLKVTSLKPIDANDMLELRNLHLRVEFSNIAENRLDEFAQMPEAMIAPAELTINADPVYFKTEVGSESAPAGSRAAPATDAGKLTGAKKTAPVNVNPSARTSPSAAAQGNGNEGKASPPPPGPDKYDPFAALVKTAGALMSAAFAIVFAWRRRARWEPSEQDVHQGAERVAGLLTAVLIMVVWVRFATPNYKDRLIVLAIVLGAVATLMLIVYGYLVSNQTYYVDKDEAGNRVSKYNIIGGFWLTEYAAKESRTAVPGQPPPTIQAILVRVDCQKDQVWPRPSRSTAKAVFVVCYILLVVCGSVALAAASFAVSLSASAS